MRAARLREYRDPLVRTLRDAHVRGGHASDKVIVTPGHTPSGPR